MFYLDVYLFYSQQTNVLGVKPLSHINHPFQYLAKVKLLHAEQPFYVFPHLFCASRNPVQRKVERQHNSIQAKHSEERKKNEHDKCKRYPE